jgi:hypothetical protein
MAQPSPDRDQAIERIRDLFALDLTKIVLSIIILLSVFPMSWSHRFGVVFFTIFAGELSLRGLLFLHDFRQRKIQRIEVLFLALDLIATLSFLPIESLWNNIRLLRLFRLSRMLLLLGYWGPIVREVGNILAKRERRYQISFVVVSMVLLSFTSALLLEHFRVQGIDFNSDGNLHNDTSFWSMLWWSFRQIESPDNIITDPEVSLGFFFSIFLTLVGLFLFTFLIGIGNSIVEELVAVSKERRLGMRKHTVICNISAHAKVLLQELTTYYAKSFRPPRIVTLGPALHRFDYMYEGVLQRIRYRHGQALSSHDLIKVDADRATRVILLSSGNPEVADSEIISQILSVREVNPRCALYAELLRSDSIQAALQAGGEHFSPIMANRLVSMFIANIIVFPGIEEIYGDLLTSKGDEIYTCLYDQGAMSGKQPPSASLLPFGDLLERAHAAHGVILLGYLVADESVPSGFVQALNPGAMDTEGRRPFPAVPAVDRLCGFFGVASNFEGLKAVLDSLPDISAPLPSANEQVIPRFGVCPGASNISRFLICGFHRGIVDFLEELFLFTKVPLVYLMVPESYSVAEVIRSFVERPEEPNLFSVEGTRLLFAQDGPDQIQIRHRHSDLLSGTIHVIKAEWSDERVLQNCHEHNFRLEEIDAALLTYTPEEADPDGRTALALLHLLRLKQAPQTPLKASFRVFCEVQHSEKAALFQRRFGQQRQRDGQTCSTVSIIAAESLRNSFIAQAIFVPGISMIYRELLSEAGMYLCKLLVRERPTDDAWLTFGQLLSVLYERDSMLLLAVELQDPQGGHPRLAINPRPKSPDYTFPANHLISVFAVGHFAQVEKSPYCRDCFAPKGSAGEA